MLPLEVAFLAFRDLVWTAMVASRADGLCDGKTRVAEILSKNVSAVEEEKRAGTYKMDQAREKVGVVGV